MMRGFEQEDIGLFTFYRSQAQQQQRRQQQKRQEQEKKRIKRQQYRIKKQQQQKQKRAYKFIASVPSVNTPRLNYTQKAKKYIKQIQLYGHNKLMRKYQKKQKKNQIKAQQSQKLLVKQKPQQFARYNNFQEQKKQNKHQRLGISNSEQIFINKKDVIKSGFYYLLNKQALAPKQFNSIQIFQINNPPQSRKFLLMEQSVRKRVALTQQKQQKYFKQRLPKLSPDYNSAKSSQCLPKREAKKQKNHYNPIDIILNNQKYQIHQLQKTNRIHAKQQQNLKMDMINNDHRESSVLAMIKRFKLIK